MSAISEGGELLQFAANRLETAVRELRGVVPFADLPALPEAAQLDLAHVVETLRAVLVDITSIAPFAAVPQFNMSSFRRVSLFAAATEGSHEASTTDVASTASPAGSPVGVPGSTSDVVAVGEWINKTFSTRNGSVGSRKRLTGKGESSADRLNAAHSRGSDGSGGFILTKGKGLVHVDIGRSGSLSASMRNMTSGQSTNAANSPRNWQPVAVHDSTSARPQLSSGSQVQLHLPHSSSHQPHHHQQQSHGPSARSAAALLPADVASVALSMEVSESFPRMPSPFQTGLGSDIGRRRSVTLSPTQAASRIAPFPTITTQSPADGTTSATATTTQASTPQSAAIAGAASSTDPSDGSGVAIELNKTLHIERTRNSCSFENVAASVDPAVADAWFESINAAIAERRCVEELWDLSRLPRLTQLINDPDFDIFAFHSQYRAHTLTVLATNVFLQYPLVCRMKLSPVKLVNYLGKVESLYGYERPYHNAIHAADVLWSAHVYLMQQSTRDNFTDMEVLATLFAALVHDVGHPGVNNDFLVRSSHPLAILYNDASPNEAMHTALSFLLFKVHPETNFFRPETATVGGNVDDSAAAAAAAVLPLGVSQLDEELICDNEDVFRPLVTQLVLGTDMKFHAGLIHTLSMSLAGGVIGDDDINLLLKAIIHAADLSNPMKPRHVYVQWIERVIAEFWQQGDAERQMGLPVSPHCDRHSPMTVPQTQVGFISFVVRPFMQQIEPLLPPIWMQRLDENLDAMKTMVAAVSGATVSRGVLPLAPSSSARQINMDEIRALAAVPWQNNFHSSPFVRMVNQLALLYKERSEDALLIPELSSDEHSTPPRDAMSGTVAPSPRGAEQLTTPRDDNFISATRSTDPAKRSVRHALSHLHDATAQLLDEMSKPLPSRAVAAIMAETFTTQWCNVFHAPWPPEPTSQPHLQHAPQQSTRRSSSRANSPLQPPSAVESSSSASHNGVGDTSSRSDASITPSAVPAEAQLIADIWNSVFGHFRAYHHWERSLDSPLSRSALGATSGNNFLGADLVQKKGAAAERRGSYALRRSNSTEPTASLSQFLGNISGERKAHTLTPLQQTVPLPTGGGSGAFASEHDSRSDVQSPSRATLAWPLHKGQDYFLRKKQ